MTLPITLLPALINEISKGKCFAYIGAGLSLGAKLPTWEGLVDQMIEWVMINRPGRINEGIEADLKSCRSNGRFPQACQILKAQLVTADFADLLRHIFDAPYLSPTSCHELIAQIPFKSLLTTNFDKLLEKVHNTPFQSIYTHKSTGEFRRALNSDSQFILKLHGNIDDIDSIILSEDDYQILMDDNSDYKRGLENIFSGFTVLFIGASLRDPDLLKLLESVVSSTGGYSNTHYAILPTTSGQDEFSEKLYHQYHVQAIFYQPSNDSHPEVQAILQTITESVATPQRVFVAPPKESEEGSVAEDNETPRTSSTTQVQPKVIVPEDFIQILLQLSDNLLSFDEWQRLPSLSVSTIGFEVDDNRKDFIKSVGDMTVWQNVVGIRLKGNIGVGKTRLVLEAIKANALETTAIYAVKPSSLPPHFFTLISTTDLVESPITIVVDNSTYEQTMEIWFQAASCSKNIRLVCIETTPNATVENPNEFVLSPLNFEALSRIVHCIYEEYKVSVFNDDKKSYAQTYVEGNVKLLIAYVKAFLSHPEVKGLSELVSKERLHRILADMLPLDFNLLRVLQAISVFGAVNVSATSTIWGRDIADFIGMSWTEFRSAVQLLVEQGLVVENVERIWPMESDHLRCVSPKLLEIFLLTTVWKTHGDELSDIVASDRNAQRIMILKGLSNLGNRKIAEPIVRRIMSECKEFTDIDAELIAVLGEADPITTITHIEPILLNASDEELTNLQGKQSIVSMLAKALRLKETCLPAARLIARFAMVEKEDNNAENANRVWRSIFFVRLAGNPASGEERHRLITRMLAASSITLRKLAVVAIRTTLHNWEGDFIRHGIGGYLSPHDWYPKTWAEFWDVRRKTFDLLDKAIEDVATSVAQEALDVLFAMAQQQMPVLFEEVISRFERHVVLHKLRVGKSLNEILHHHSDKLSPDQINRINALKNLAFGNNFQDRLIRYIIDGNSSAEDRYSDHRAFEEETNRQVRLLAQEAIDSPHLLEAELEKLADTSPQYPTWLRGFMFFLGELDGKRYWFNKLRVVTEKSLNWVAFEYYLRGRIEAGDKDWIRDEALGLTQNSRVLAPATLEIALRLDPTVLGVSIVVTLLHKGWISAQDIGWREYWAELISADSLYAVLDEINQNRNLTVDFAAIKLLAAHLEKQQTDATRFAEVALTLLREFKGSPQTFQEWDAWQKLAFGYRVMFPLQVIDAVLTVYDQHDLYFSDDKDDWMLIEAVLRVSPLAIWEKIAQRFLPENDEDDHTYGGYARNFRRINFTDIVEVENLVNWVGTSRDRASLLAEMIDVSRDVLNPTARELVIRFPTDEEVTKALYRNFRFPVNDSHPYRDYIDWGEASNSSERNMLVQLRTKAINWLENEHQQDVVRWLNEVIGDLDERLNGM